MDDYAHGGGVFLKIRRRRRGALIGVVQDEVVAALRQTGGSAVLAHVVHLEGGEVRVLTSQERLADFLELLKAFDVECEGFYRGPRERCSRSRSLP